MEMQDVTVEITAVVKVNGVIVPEATVESVVIGKLILPNVVAS